VSRVGACGWRKYAKFNFYGDSAGSLLTIGFMHVVYHPQRNAIQNLHCPQVGERCIDSLST